MLWTFQLISKHLFLPFSPGQYIRGWLPKPPTRRFVSNCEPTTSRETLTRKHSYPVPMRDTQRSKRSMTLMLSASWTLTKPLPSQKLFWPGWKAYLHDCTGTQSARARSIGVTAAGDAWLDIVPTTPVSSDEGSLWLPDREVREWTKCHPKGQIAAAADKNKATDGYYVQVVKLMKVWRDRLPTELYRVKSYILETLVHGSIGRPTSHAEAVVNILEGIERSYGGYRNTKTVPFLSDLVYSSANVAKRWSSEEILMLLWRRSR